PSYRALLSAPPHTKPAHEPIGKPPISGIRSGPLQYAIEARKVRCVGVCNLEGSRRRIGHQYGNPTRGIQVSGHLDGVSLTRRGRDGELEIRAGPGKLAEDR